MNLNVKSATNLHHPNNSSHKYTYKFDLVLKLMVISHVTRLEVTAFEQEENALSPYLFYPSVRNCIDIVK